MRRLCSVFVGFCMVLALFTVSWAASEQATKLRSNNNLSVYLPAESFIAGNFVADEVGDPVIFDTDEDHRFGTTLDTLKKLKPNLKPDGTVTAGNASGINDSAAIIIVVSATKAASSSGITGVCCVIILDPDGPRSE